MMEYVLPNILAAASFDKTAKAIIARGLSRTVSDIGKKIIFKESGCWELKTKPGNFGYQRHKMRNSAGVVVLYGIAHRVSWLISGMSVTPGLVLDHKCRNRGCINPHHLREVTQQENTLCGESLQAKNAKKTHCDYGHELSGYNVRTTPRQRSCRTCARNHTARYRRRKREENGK
jgi:hypothetical protein